MPAPQDIAKAKLAKLESLFKLATDSLTREEFVGAFKAVLKAVAKSEQDLKVKIDNKTSSAIEALNKLEGEFASIIQKTKEESDSSLSTLKKRTLEMINSFFLKSTLNKKLKALIESHAQKVKEFDSLNETVREKLETITSGDDGNTPTDEELSSLIKPLMRTDDELLALITPLIPVIDTPKTETSQEVLDDIAELRIENEKQQKDIKELEKRPVGRGGGTSAIGVAQAFKYIAHTEAPVGAIDGSNTTYTVSKDIWWIAGFTLNGEQIAELPNFTFTGRTITFSTALPSVYSGKDFEIKFIG